MTVSLNHLGDLVRKRVAVAAYYFVPGRELDAESVVVM